MSSPRILIIEDERIVALDIQGRLQRLGYTVTGVASTGAAAIQAATEQIPDLALVDIRLKGAMDGIEVAEHFRERLRVPVVFLTANTDPATVERAKQTEPFGYLVKPFDEKDLHTTIEVALHKCRMENRLRDSEEWLSAILRCIGDGVIATDRDLAVRFLNPIAEEFVGYSSRDALGKPLSVVFKVSDESNETVLLNPAVRAVQENLPVSSRGAVHISREGIKRILDLTAWPIRGADSRAAGVVLALRDITEYRRASAALRRSEERYKDLFENANDVVFVLDPSGHFLSVNKAAERVMRYSRTELLGMHLSELVVPEQRAAASRLAAGSPETLSRTPVELLVRTQDGNFFVLEVDARVQLQDGVPDAVQAIARDITDRKKAERVLAEQAKELARSNQELERFAYVASHDLQEPLRMVSSYVQLLARRYQGKLDANADEFIRHIVDGSRRMQAFIQDLLAYSRVSSEKREVKLVDCQQVLELALTNLSSRIRDSGATITHEPLPSVAGDATQLLQLFQNLLSNAMKFRGLDAPRIHLSAAKEGSQWVFSVRDNGVGVEPGDAERIFGIFERGRARDASYGAGIGLAICEKIVEGHRGRIWVDSSPGHGSTFRFTIPTSGGDLPAHLGQNAEEDLQ